MKIVSFNIRCDCGADGDNNFVFRKPFILDALNREQPDIVGFQEVLPHVAAWLGENLGDYCVLGCGREADLGGEQVTVAFRKSRFQLLRMNTFWLSETPFVPGSRYPEQSDCPRTCAELLLYDLAEKRPMRFVNTHLDHRGKLAQKEGLAQIVRYLDAQTFFPDAPAVLTGDFNVEPGDEVLEPLRRRADFRDATAGIGPTYHGYGKCGHAIDYIFYKGALTLTRADKWTQCAGGVYLSDHYPVCAEFE